MPGRAVVTSPGGTAAISIPSDPNFMWTGLVTCAPFFGSMKNTLAFFACAPADTLNAPMIATTSSASCFRLCMVTLLWPDILEPFSLLCSGYVLAGCPDRAQDATTQRLLAVRTALAEQAPKPSARPLLGQLPGRRLPTQDPVRDGVPERLVERGRHNRRPAAAGDGADVGAQRGAFLRPQAAAGMFQDQHVRIERQPPPQPESNTRGGRQRRDRLFPDRFMKSDFVRQRARLPFVVVRRRFDLERERHREIL